MPKWALHHPLEYGLTYAYGQLNPSQQWLADITSVRVKEIAIVAFSLAILGFCYFGFVQIAAYAFFLGTTSTVVVIAPLYFGGQLSLFLIAFFLSICLTTWFMHGARVSRSG